MDLVAPPHQVNEFNYIWKKWFNTIYEMLRGPAWGTKSSSVIAGKQGATAPTLAAFGPSGTIEAYSFAVNDFVYMPGLHIPMNITPNSKVYLNVHWTTDGTDTNTVKWEIIYTYAAAETGAVFPTETTVTLESTPAGVAWTHSVSEVTDAQALSNLLPETIILARLRRVTNGGTDNTDTVFGLHIDIHFQQDRLGSAKKDYDFYKRGN